MKTYRLLILLTIIFATGCASNKIVKVHPSYSEMTKNIKTIVMLPPNAKMERLVFTGENEDLSYRAEYAMGQFGKFMNGKLPEKNYEIKVVDFDSLDDQNIAYLVSEIKNEYSAKKQSMISRLNPKKDDSEDEDTVVIRQASSAIIPSLNELADYFDADAFLLSNYYAYEKSGGLIAKDLAAATLLAILAGGYGTAVEANSGHSLDVGLIEATTGHVLWTDNESSRDIVVNDLFSVMDSLPSATREIEPVKQNTEESLESTSEPIATKETEEGLDSVSEPVEVQETES